MKTKKSLQIFFLTIAFALTFLIVDQHIAHAQSGCTDAAGAPVDCPSTDDSSTSSDTGGDSGSTNKPTNTPEPVRPTLTPVPTATLFIPTATPITIANPVDDPGGDSSGWSGTCEGSTKEITHCIGVFTNACEHVGGSADGDVQKDGSVKMTCTVPATADPSPSESTDPMPTSEPPGSSTGENDGSPAAGCGNDPKNPDLVIDCALKLTNKCLKAGGSSSQTPQEDGSILVFCSKWIFDEPLPEDENELSAFPTNTDDDVTCHDMFCVMDIYIGCWWSNGKYGETANPDGSISVSCDPKTGTGPANPIPYPGLPLLGLGVVIIIGIPAFVIFQGGKGGKRTKPKPEPKPEPKPRSGFTRKEHVLLNKEDDGSSAGDVDLNGKFDAPDVASASGRDIIVSRDDKDKD